MKKNNLKLLLLAGCLALLCIAVVNNLGERRESIRTEEKIFLRLKKNTGPIIRGFQFSNYHKGRKALYIKAAKFSVEKKKIGLFRLSPFKIARFRDAEIEFYGVTGRHTEKENSPRKPLSHPENSAPAGIQKSFRGLLSPETLPTQAMKGSVSAICEPIKIILYLNDAPVTMIQAEKAIVDPRRRSLILRKNIQVTSGNLNLSTDRLVIYPETGLFEMESKYVLKTQ